MSSFFSKKTIERFSRQMILKKVGPVGQKKIMNSKVLVVGAGGLGCPVIDLLARAGVRNLGIVDFDKVSLSNLQRQNLFNSTHIGKFKVDVIKQIVPKIYKDTKLKIFKKKILENNVTKIISNYEIVVDASDNFETKFLLNKHCLKNKKTLIVGAISKFDGHIFHFNFKNKNTPCLKCFYQTDSIDVFLDCEEEGVLGPVAGIVGSIQANEVLKSILGTKNLLIKQILIIDLFKTNFRKVKFFKKKECIC